uniref:xaa-Arg dipeptidase-like n=1 Tax=Euleptes europaea TaxID=460621 RepID=UPI00253F8140|nr:xaa-Arg dipeptidase-like [Euleptes europaea]
MALLLEELKRRAGEGIEASSSALGELGRAIWSRPELAYEERQAHAALTRFFAARPAWAVQPAYKLETAFRADWAWAWPGAEPPAAPLRLAFLCEYDALPGLGHACGHNLIAQVGAAAALGLQAALEGLAPRGPAVQVTVLGTPAEEVGGGKVQLIETGAFDNLDVVFMAHPFQKDMPYMPALANHHVIVKYYGKASHAAAYPWEGINALDAAVLAYNNLSVLRQQMKPAWRVHGVIKQGGEIANIIPSCSELEFFLRTPLLKDLPVLTDKAESCFKAAALATGCKIELKTACPDYYNVLPNKSLQQTYMENGKSLGMEFLDQMSSFSGSTDFGNVSHVVPGIHAYFYIGSDALNHTEQFTEAAGSKVAQQYALRTAKALAMTAVDVLFRPGLLERVREDFRQAKQEEQEHYSVKEEDVPLGY